MIELRFPYTEKQRGLFRKGVLVTSWFQKYPRIFDKEDARLAKSQPTYHFFEWLSAILLFESTGYLSLLEKWDCPSHAKKHRLFKSIVGRDLAGKILAKSVGMPDLFVYSKDKISWYFCEVKGSRDKLRDYQKRQINALEKITGKEVLLVNFIKAP
jgi:hypothetical protein